MSHRPRDPSGVNSMTHQVPPDYAEFRSKLDSAPDFLHPQSLIFGGGGPLASDRPPTSSAAHPGWYEGGRGGSWPAWESPTDTRSRSRDHSSSRGESSVNYPLIDPAGAEITKGTSDAKGRRGVPDQSPDQVVSAGHSGSGDIPSGPSPDTLVVEDYDQPSAASSFPSQVQSPERATYIAIANNSVEDTVARAKQWWTENKESRPDLAASHLAEKLRDKWDDTQDNSNLSVKVMIDKCGCARSLVKGRAWVSMAPKHGQRT